MSCVKIRRLIESDLDNVMEIENLCFVSPWQKDDIVRELNNRGIYDILALDVEDMDITDPRIVNKIFEE